MTATIRTFGPDPSAVELDVIEQSRPLLVGDTCTWRPNNTVLHNPAQCERCSKYVNRGVPKWVWRKLLGLPEVHEKRAVEARWKVAR